MKYSSVILLNLIAVSDKRLECDCSIPILNAAPPAFNKTSTKVYLQAAHKYEGR